MGEPDGRYRYAEREVGYPAVYPPFVVWASDGSPIAYCYSRQDAMLVTAALNLISQYNREEEAGGGDG